MRLDVQAIDEDQVRGQARDLKSIDDFVHRSFRCNIELNDVSHRITGQILRQRGEEFECDLHCEDFVIPYRRCKPQRR